MGQVLKRKFLKVAHKKGLKGKSAEIYSIRKAYPKESKGLSTKEVIKKYGKKKFMVSDDGAVKV